MKNKTRYLLVKTTYNIDDGKSFFKSLNKELILEIGELNYSSVNPKLTLVLNNNIFIIKANLFGFNTLVAALSLIKRINNEPCAFYTIKSSGTIKALMKNFDTKNYHILPKETIGKAEKESKV
ncbi:MAG: Rpp14/Pop5 family protein [Candidatus Marsarchaeota archaeon]|jgi:RNase P/RNase MRP subunit POP5|nr:Rpp14/Pop5 family protein [Candidatus Marsarchaeota archaeon]